MAEDMLYMVAMGAGIIGALLKDVIVKYVLKFKAKMNTLGVSDEVMNMGLEQLQKFVGMAKVKYKNDPKVVAELVAIDYSIEATQAVIEKGDMPKEVTDAMVKAIADRLGKLILKVGV
jgi:hypothetical protein